MPKGVMNWYLPPKAKIYEALSALGDGRVTIITNTSAQVVSSAGNKTYDIEWSEDGSKITSNDNASYWQGYLGYPIVAVLMARSVISFDHAVAKQLAGIPWKDVNTKFRNNYDKAVQQVLGDVELRGGSPEAVIKEVDLIYAQLEGMGLGRMARRKLPPKA